MSGDGEGDGLRKRKRYGDCTQAEKVTALLEHFPDSAKGARRWGLGFAVMMSRAPALLP